MVVVLLADGFEDIEAIAPVDILRRADISVFMAGVTGDTVTSSHGVRVQADIRLEDVNPDELEMLVLPGGKGVEKLKASAAVSELVRKVYAAEKLIGAICAAPTILAELGLLEGRRAVCYPSCEPELTAHGAKIQRDEQVTHDRNLITAQAAGVSVAFGLKLVAMLRGWAVAERVRCEICYDFGSKSLT